jgi:hypothetical protein
MIHLIEREEVEVDDNAALAVSDQTHAVQLTAGYRL